MKSKEILDINAQEILRKILMGESLTKIQKDYGIDKGTIVDYFRDIFKKDEGALEKFNKILEIKKKETSKVKVNNEKFKECVLEYIKGSCTLKQSAQKLGIHFQTFQKLMEEYISNNEKLTQLYKIKQQQRGDYSNIDFKELIVEMLKTKCMQKDIEEKYGLKPKTLSRKIEYLENDEDSYLYKACKILSNANMCKRELTTFEDDYINDAVKNYEEEKNKKDEIEEERE